MPMTDPGTPWLYAHVIYRIFDELEPWRMRNVLNARLPEGWTFAETYAGEHFKGVSFRVVGPIDPAKAAAVAALLIELEMAPAAWPGEPEHIDG
jgi:hypothetical protein